jgi:hypothetical protein
MDLRFLLWQMTDDPAHEDEAWLDEYFARYTHPVCKHEINSPNAPACLHVQNVNSVSLKHLGNDRMLNFCLRTGLTIIRAELLAILQPLLPSHFHLGRVVVNGIESPEHSVLTADHWVVLRGGLKSHFFPCEQCHQWMYIPMGVWYLLESQVPTEPVAMTCYGGGLILTDSIAKAIKGRRWKSLSIRPLPVKSKPTDGFPEHLAPIPESQQRQPRGLQGWSDANP